jgi:hypothetical protein
MTKLKISDCKFDWVNSAITDTLFDEPQEVFTEYDVVTISKPMSPEEVITQMEKEGYRPANFQELLAYSQKEWNGKDTVVALGSVAEVSGGRLVPYLCRGVSERSLGLLWWDRDWSSSCCFLRVRNSVSKTSDTGDSDTLTLAIETVKKAGYKVIKEI